LALLGVSAAVTALVLAPLAAPGYVLSYDMVFVPHQPLRADLVAPSATLPRAVPLDALVSLATQVVPGWAVQRIALLALLFCAAVGAGRLVPAGSVLPRLVAAVGYAWTPYLAERLLLGQWALLLAYAALPWIVAEAVRFREGDRRALPRLVLVAAPAAVTPTGGVIAVVVTAVLLARRDAWRGALAAVAGVALLNAPWLVATALTSADARSDPDGIAAFAARAENWSGALGALAGTGGIWNAQTTLPSQSSPLAPAGTVLLLALAVAGWGALRRGWPPGTAVRLAVLAGGGFAVAALAVLPGGAALLRWLVASVPGAGLIRDGHKFLMPYALLLCLAAALGAARLAGHLAVRLGGPAAPALLAGALLLPVLMMPDLAFGGAGRLRPVAYPADWAVVARQIGQRPGEVVSLPLGGYRTYPWNAGRTVIDPLPRYVDADVLVDDALIVGGLVVQGENPRVAAVSGLIAAGAPVAAAGMRWVVVQRVVGGRLPAGALTGLRLVHAGKDLSLYENPAATARPVMSPSVPVVVAGLVSIMVLLAAAVALRTKATAW
jgi:hypothetical protein